MSARQWKIRLEESQRRYGEVELAAREWRQVAENRLALIGRLDKVLSHCLEDLVGVGEIFGVSVQLPEEVWTPTEGMDAGSVVMYIMGKIEAMADFQAALLKESSEVQVTLNDTYTLACQAVGVQRPQMDLTVPLDTEKVSEPSSPYRDLQSSLNDLPYENHDSAPKPPPKSTERPVAEDLTGADRALSLFKRN